jgi:hypothetical protein
MSKKEESLSLEKADEISQQRQLYINHLISSARSTDSTSTFYYFYFRINNNSNQQLIHNGFQ